MHNTDENDENLESRTDRKRVRMAEVNAREELAEQLIGLAPQKLKHVPLDDELVRCISMAADMKMDKGRRRMVRRIRNLLQNADIESIKNAVAWMQEHRAPPGPKPADPTAEWTDRIVGSDEGIEAFIEIVGSVDRTRLRQLARAVRKAPAADRRARSKLSDYVRSELRTAGASDS